MKHVSAAVLSLLLAGVGFAQDVPATNAAPAAAVVAVYGTEELRYDRPATRRGAALPLGNGRLAALVYGGVVQDRLTLNEETIWTGGPLASDAGGLTREQVEQARERIFAGKPHAAADGLPERFAQTAGRLPFGELVVKTVLPEGETSGYVRTLSLETAVARTSFVRGGVTYTREAFTSFTDDVVVYHLAADQEGAIAFEATLTSPHEVSCVVEEGLLVVRGETGEAPRARTAALAFEGALAVRTQGGTVAVEDGKVVVSQADEATIFVSLATNYRNFRALTDDPTARCRAALGAAMKVPCAAAKKAHAAFYRAQADRCTLSLGSWGNPTLTTDARVRTFPQTDDPAFAAFAFRFGRYLLIASQQPGTQPTPPRIFWNDAWPTRTRPPLNLDAVLDCRTAEAVGLGDLGEPAWRLCDELAVTGADIARKVYGADGWTAHRHTDIWRVASPNGPQAEALWPMGGADLALQLWTHWLYTRDRDFLAGHYAVLKGAADFVASILVRNPGTDHLTVCPGGPLSDAARARQLLTAVAEATRLLGGDEAYATRLRNLAAAVEPVADAVAACAGDEAYARLKTQQVQGWLAGMVPLFLQAEDGTLDLLPALPRAWPQGRVAGLCAPGGFKVEIVWMEGRLVQARVTSELGEPCTVRYAGKTHELALKKGESVLLTQDDFAPAASQPVRAPKGHFWETRPLKEGVGYTWSMTTRVGDMLAEAEKLFGPRDRSWTILGAEIRADGKGVPQNWFPGYPGRKDIVFQVVPPADVDAAEAVFQLAHEVVHALSPMPGQRATVLEEGVAAWFSAYYARKAKGADIHSSRASYRQAHDCVARLLARDHQAILKLRQVEPCFSRMTAETFATAGVDASKEEITALLTPFTR